MKRIFLAFSTILALGALAGPSWGQDNKALQYCQGGTTLYGQKHYDQAIQYFEAAIQADPTLWQAYQGEGSCYYAKGEKEKCLPYFQKALSLHRDNPSLAAFIDTLRAQTRAVKPTPTQTPLSAYDREKIYRQAAGVTGEHFELSPAVGAVFYDDTLGIGGGASGFYMFDTQFGIGGMLRLYLFNYSYSSSQGTYNNGPSSTGTYTETTTETDTSVELVPCVKYKLGGSPLEPYLVAGLGLADVSAGWSYSYNYQNGPPYGTSPAKNSPPAPSAIFPMLTAGMGLEYRLGPELKLFLEGRADVILGQYGAATLIPIEGGLNFNM